MQLEGGPLGAGVMITAGVEGSQKRLPNAPSPISSFLRYYELKPTKVQPGCRAGVLPETT